MEDTDKRYIESRRRRRSLYALNNVVEPKVVKNNRFISLMKGVIYVVGGAIGVVFGILTSGYVILWVLNFIVGLGEELIKLLDKL